MRYEGAESVLEICLLKETGTPFTLRAFSLEFHLSTTFSSSDILKVDSSVSYPLSQVQNQRVLRLCSTTVSPLLLSKHVSNGWI